MKRDLTSLQRECLERMEATCDWRAQRVMRNGRWTIGEERVSSEPMMQLLRRGLITEVFDRDEYFADPRRPTEYVITAEGRRLLADVRGAW